jgi:hypothetical protein
MCTTQGRDGFDFKLYMSFQCEEIRKHRYLESEKAGRDLGAEAERDWIMKFSKRVRAWVEETGQFMNAPTSERNQ